MFTFESGACEIERAIESEKDRKKEIERETGKVREKGEKGRTIYRKEVIPYEYSTRKRKKNEEKNRIGKNTVFDRRNT